MTRAKDISKIVTDANFSGTLDVTGAFTSQGIDDNADATAITIDSSENVGIGTASPNSNGLHVEKSASNAMGVTISNTEGSGSRFDLYAFGSSPSVQSAHRNAIYQWTGNGIDLWSRVGDLHFGTNNTEKMRIDSSGNVGIGTSSPTEKLDLVGGSLRIQRGSDTDTIVRLDGADGSTEYLGLGIASGNGVITGGGVGSTNTGLVFKTAASGTETERMRITSTGNVGIGDNNPNARLVVNVATNANLAVQNTGGALQLQGINDAKNAFTSIDIAGNPITFSPNSTEAMRIDSTGNVGIGTTSPTPQNGKVLHIHNSSGAADLRLTNNITGTALGNGTILTLSGSTAYLYNYENADFVFGTNQIERMRITSGGNVGIGTNSPSARLTVSELASTTLATFDSTSARMYFGINNTATSYFDVDTLIFRNSPSSGATERMRIDSNGTVFINGTTSAVFNGGLNVETTSAGTTTTALALHNQSGGNDSGVQISHRGKRNTGAQHDYSYIQSVADDVTAGNGSLRFWTSGSASLAERMRITSAGNVGIGTSSPDTNLDVEGAGDCTISITANSTSHDSKIDFVQGSTIEGGITYDHNGSYASEKMAFRAGNNGTHMYLFGDGNLMLGKTSTSNAVGGIRFSPAQELIIGRDGTSAHDMIDFYRGNSGSLGRVGNIRTQDSSTSYNTSSDYRLKENVNYTFDATTRLKQLRPARFNFIVNADVTVDGFLAHEVQSVVPEAITGTHNEVDADGNPVYQGIDQSKLVPLLVKTIQELEARIVALETA